MSGLVAQLLQQLVGDVPDYDEAWAEEEALMSAGLDMRVGGITWDREALHER